MRGSCSSLSGISLGLILLTAGALLPGCAGKDKISSGIIPLDKMKAIVWDMVQTDTYTDQYLAKDSTGRARLQTLQLYAQVLQLHQVSREDFRKSFQFYSERPDLSRELFDSVQALGARDRAAHPPILQSKAGLPVTAKGGIPEDRVIPNRPGVQPTFNFRGRVPHGIPPNATPGSHPPIPPPHPTPGAHPPPRPAPAAHHVSDSSTHRIHSQSPHPATDTSIHHHRSPATSKPSTKDII